MFFYFHFIISEVVRNLILQDPIIELDNLLICRFLVIGGILNECKMVLQKAEMLHDTLKENCNCEKENNINTFFGISIESIQWNKE